MSKLIGIIPINFNNIYNKYNEDFNSINITRIYITSQYNMFVMKKKKEHNNTNNIIESFCLNQKISPICEKNIKVINYGWISNINIYLFIIDNPNYLSSEEISEVPSDKIYFNWKCIINTFKEKENTDVYENILKNNNSQLNQYISYEKNNDIKITLKDIYEKLIGFNIIK